MALLPVDNNEGEFVVEIRDSPPADLVMKIESFSKLWKHGVEKHESSEFTTGIYKWRLMIYPQVSDNISVYLSVSDTKSLPVGWNVDANCTILLHNQISDNYFCFRGKTRRFDAMNVSWGFSISSRMLRDPCNGYLVDDNCTFGAEVFISKRDILNECLSLHDWKITDFSELKSTVWTSEEFSAGGLRWKIMLFPNGNKNRKAKGKSVSIYLECVDAKTFASHEKVEAEFCIRIRSKLPHAHCSKRTSHWFTSAEDDWGFTHFVPISDMRDPGKGFIINDCCLLETEITVLDAVYKPK